MDRFTLTPSDNLMWIVKDEQTGFSITFREGLFNESQDVTTPESLTQELILRTPTIMREIGDWLAENHSEVCICNPQARIRAIYTLSHEKYWLTLADAMSSLIIDWSSEEMSDRLCDLMDDYIDMQNSMGLSELESNLLIGSLSLLDNEEANEVVNIIHVFWKYKSDMSIDIDNWARDILWWPSYC